MRVAVEEARRELVREFLEDPLVPASAIKACLLPSPLTRGIRNNTIT